ncbi:protein meiotic P26-like [Glandiceps talaboti]
MASSLNRDDFVRAFLECPICLSRYQHPKILACYHSFCEHCLQSIVDNNFGRLRCPLDRKQQRLPSGGVPALPSSTHLQGLLEYFDSGQDATSSSTSHQCNGCDRKAFRYCIECGDYLCKQCSSAHTRLNLTRNHQLITMKEYEETVAKESPFLRPIICPHHRGNQIKLYCETCSVPICVECTLFDHSKPAHRFVKLDVAAKEKRRWLTESKNELKSKITEMSKFRGEIMAQLNQLSAEDDIARNNLWERYNRHVQHLKDQAISLEQDLCDISKPYKDALQLQQQSIDALMKRLDNTFQFTEVFLAQSNDVGFVWLEAQARANISRLIQDVHDMKVATPPKGEQIKFISNEDFIGTVTKQQIGQIIQSHSENILSWNVFDAVPEKPKLTLVKRWPGSGPVAISPMTGNCISLDADCQTLQVRNRMGVKLAQIPLPVQRYKIPRNGITVDDDGRIYIVAGSLYFCHESGKRFQKFHSENLDGPCNVAMMPDNLLYISHPSQRKTTVHSTNGRYVRTISTDNLHCDDCTTFAVDGRGHFYYTGACGMAIYLHDGRSEREIKTGLTDRPVGCLAVDARNNIFMANRIHTFLNVCQQHGQQLAQFQMSSGQMAIKPYTLSKQILLMSDDKEVKLYDLTY